MGLSARQVCEKTQRWYHGVANAINDKSSSWLLTGSKLALPSVIPKHKLGFHGTTLPYVRAVDLLPALPNLIPKHKLQLHGNVSRKNHPMS